MRARVTGWKLDEALDRYLTQGVPLSKAELEGVYAKGWTKGRNVGMFVGASAGVFAFLLWILTS